MATLQENIDSMNSAFQTHMKNKNPGVDATTTTNIEEFSLAYATAIANAIGAGSSGVNMSDYIKKSGGADGVMSGEFSSLNGFIAGVDNYKRIEATSNGVEIIGQLNHNGSTFNANDKIVFYYDTNLLDINSNGDFSSGIKLSGAIALIENKLQVGDDNLGFYTDSNDIRFKTFNIYHAGNLNKDDVDFTMRHGDVKGDLTIGGSTTFNGSLSALNSFQGGKGGNVKITAIDNGVAIVGDLYLGEDNGIKGKGDIYILKGYANGNSTINAVGENLFLGYSDTKKIALSTDLYNDDATRKLIDKDGECNFLWGAKLGFGNDVKIDVVNEGVVLSDGLMFGDDRTKLSKGENDLLVLTNPNGNIELGADINKAIFNTNKGYFSFNKYIEAVDKVMIKESQTRIENNKLFLSNDHYLQNVTEGVKVFGNLYSTGEMGTQSFSEGYSGSGWRINENAEGTLDVLTVRKKLNIYAFDVQKITASNGSIWASASCSASTVTKL